MESLTNSNNPRASAQPRLAKFKTAVSQFARKVKLATKLKKKPTQHPAGPAFRECTPKATPGYVLIREASCPSLTSSVDTAESLALPSPVLAYDSPVKSLKRMTREDSIARRWSALCDVKEPAPKAPYVALNARLSTIMPAPRARVNASDEETGLKIETTVKKEEEADIGVEVKMAAVPVETESVGEDIAVDQASEEFAILSSVSLTVIPTSHDEFLVLAAITVLDVTSEFTDVADAAFNVLCSFDSSLFLSTHSPRSEEFLVLGAIQRFPTSATVEAEALCSLAGLFTGEADVEEEWEVLCGVDVEGILTVMAITGQEALPVFVIASASTIANLTDKEEISTITLVIDNTAQTTDNQEDAAITLLSSFDTSLFLFADSPRSDEFLILGAIQRFPTSATVEAEALCALIGLFAEEPDLEVEWEVLCGMNVDGLLEEVVICAIASAQSLVEVASESSPPSSEEISKEVTPTFVIASASTIAELGGGEGGIEEGEVEEEEEEEEVKEGEVEEEKIGEVSCDAVVVEEIVIEEITVQVTPSVIVAPAQAINRSPVQPATALTPSTSVSEVSTTINTQESVRASSSAPVISSSKIQTASESAPQPCSCWVVISCAHEKGKAREAELLQQVEGLKTVTYTTPSAPPKQCVTCHESCAKCATAPVALAGGPPPPPPPPPPMYTAPPPVTGVKVTDGKLNAVEATDDNARAPSDIANEIKRRLAQFSDGKMGLKSMTINRNDPNNHRITDIASEVKSRFLRSSAGGLKTTGPRDNDQEGESSGTNTQEEDGGEDDYISRRAVKLKATKSPFLVSPPTTTNINEEDCEGRRFVSLKPRSENAEEKNEIPVSNEEEEEEDYISRRMVTLKPVKRPIDVSASQKRNLGHGANPSTKTTSLAPPTTTSDADKDDCDAHRMFAFKPRSENTDKQNDTPDNDEEEEDYASRRMVALKPVKKIVQTPSDDEAPIPRRIVTLKPKSDATSNSSEPEDQTPEPKVDCKSALKRVEHEDDTNKHTLHQSRVHASKLLAGLTKTAGPQARSFGTDLTNRDLRGVLSKRPVQSDVVSAGGAEPISAAAHIAETAYTESPLRECEMTPSSEVVSEAVPPPEESASTFKYTRVARAPSISEAPWKTQVLKFKIPEPNASDNVRDDKTRRDLAALRSMGRVGKGSHIIANSRAFGGTSTANAGAEEYEKTLPLHCLELIERIRKRNANAECQD
ncbi:hypothetical protein BXZ70DRAFT_1034634 [Cristinia sonorae]|uniref:Uncharacterized protein n=1 Tax=Cristinia sonorae TaxID=1940300 RepID=A0A8K0XMY4_9AGAR|nr:hypothetical protein BXZ70DRAFT_1034634 [Cristinia sonorae]